MTQDERREYLIQYLLKEEIPFGRQNIPTDKQGHEEETGKAKITSYCILLFVYRCIPLSTATSCRDCNEHCKAVS